MKVRGLSPALPLTYDEGQGYRMNTQFTDVVVQNLKMLILTNPGERIMEPEFGVGLKRYLFEQNVETVHGEIEARIVNQTEKYLPYLKIQMVEFFTSETSDLPENYLHITVRFFIKPLEKTSRIDLLFDSDKGLFSDGIVKER